MQLNNSFINNINIVYKEQGKTWLEKLPTLIEEWCNQWQLEFIRPLPDLSYSFVGLVKQKDASDLAILKCVPTRDGLAKEINWLQLMKHCTPQIFNMNAEKNVIIMECLQPGYSLKEIVQENEDDRATKIICQTIKQMQSRFKYDFAYPHLSELIKDLDILQHNFDKKILSKAQSLFRDLTSDRDNDVLLHGDLHHDNILASNGRWKVIDPHGYIGDSVAEVGAMIRNPLDAFPQSLSLPKTMERRLHIMRDELGFDAQKIQAWALCMTVLSAAWTFEGEGKILTIEAEAAQAINKIKL